MEEVKNEEVFGDVPAVEAEVIAEAFVETPEAAVEAAPEVVAEVAAEEPAEATAVEVNDSDAAVVLSGGATSAQDVGVKISA